MKKFAPLELLFIFILIIGAFFWGAYFGNGGQGGDLQGEPRGGGPEPSPTSTRNLTVIRTGFIPQETIVSPGMSGFKIMEFKITNHSTSTTFLIDSFGFYPGVQNSAGSNYVRNLRTTSNGTLLWRAETLAFGYASTTGSLGLPPLTSKTFTLTADIFGFTSSTCPIPPSTIMQVALGSAHARDTSVPANPEPVFNEVSDRVLRLPSIPIDDSIESVIFRFQ